MRRTLLALLVLGACSVGQVGGGPDGGGSGAIAFNMTIKPIVNRCLGCHATTQAPNLSSFDALQTKYKTKPGNMNILITKPTLDGTPGMHHAINYFDTTEASTVASWIDSL